MSWWQMHVHVDGTSAERVSAWLEARGALAVTFAAGIDRDDASLFGEPDSPAAQLWTSVRLTALFARDMDLRPVVDELGRIADALAIASIEVDELADQDWSRSWMDRYQPRKFGDRLWVVPSWLKPPVPSDVNVLLDPGMAFGTGTHATTALCLEWLTRRSSLSGARVVDYGCGSGILAIAAAKLGAAKVVALDLDIQALQVAAENVAKNDVSAKIQIVQAEGPAIASADILIANILLGPLQGLAARLASLVKPGGELALSGLLTEQLDVCTEAYTPWFDFSERVELEGWGLVSGIRR